MFTSDLESLISSPEMMFAIHALTIMVLLVVCHFLKEIVNVKKLFLKSIYQTVMIYLVIIYMISLLFDVVSIDTYLKPQKSF